MCVYLTVKLLKVFKERCIGEHYKYTCLGDNHLRLCFVLSLPTDCAVQSRASV